jgi:hypothetical protein
MVVVRVPADDLAGEVGRMMDDRQGLSVFRLDVLPWILSTANFLM